MKTQEEIYQKIRELENDISEFKVIILVLFLRLRKKYHY